MKVVVQDEIGRAEDVLRVEERDPVAPAPGEVRLRVLAAPIHPSDLTKIAGLYGVKPKLPEIPGIEAVGEVLERGEGVAGLAVGDRVLVLGQGGTWVSEMTVPAEGLIPLPEGDPEQFAMAAANPLTAWILLHEMADLSPGDWVMQSGANSAVGRYVIQIAREIGLKTVNLVRRDGLEAELTGLGGDVVVVDGPDLPARVAEVMGGAELRLALDCVAGETFPEMVRCVAPGGTVVSYGAMSGQDITLKPGRLIFGEPVIRGFWLMQWFRRTPRAAQQATFAKLLPLVASGKLHAAVDGRYALEDIGAAVRRAGEGGRDGKVLLVPGLASGGEG